MSLARSANTVQIVMLNGRVSPKDVHIGMNLTNDAHDSSNGSDWLSAQLRAEWNKSHIPAAWWITKCLHHNLEGLWKRRFTVFTFYIFKRKLWASVSTFPTKGYYTLKLYLLFLYRLERGKEQMLAFFVSSQAFNGWGWRCSKIEKIQNPIMQLQSHCLSLPIVSTR